MISMVQTGALLNTNLTPQNTASAELVGLSTDTKPTGVSVGNGWSFIEMDTGKVFFYNAEDEEWLEFAGSGGGGQGGSNVLVVNIDDNQTLDKTWQEMYDAEYCVLRFRDDINKAVSYLSVLQIMISENVFVVACFDPQNPQQPVSFVATSANGYPALQNSQ